MMRNGGEKNILNSNIQKFFHKFTSRVFQHPSMSQRSMQASHKFSKTISAIEVLFICMKLNSHKTLKNIIPKVVKVKEIRGVYGSD